MLFIDLLFIDLLLSLYPDNSLLSNYDDDDYSQGYGQIKEAFKALTQDDILQPYISEDEFRSSNDGDNIGYGLYAYDIRYEKNFECAQPVKVEFIFCKHSTWDIWL